MAERIYVMNKQRTLQPLREEPFSTEDILQELLAEHPELLDGEQIKPADPRRWILVNREVGISETTDASPSWALDHLLIDQDAVPTLVEVKRGKNREVRRAIVGQLLEYAAHAAETWTVDELRHAFETRHGEDADTVLQNLLQSDSDTDAFWDMVTRNLVAKRLRLLFVSDDIPDPLIRVVEFLNGQMPDIEVLAVEIKQFRGESLRTLVPKVIGRTASVPTRGAQRRRKMSSLSEFYDRFDDPEACRAAERLIAVAQEEDADVSLHEQAVVIGMRCSLQKTSVNVAWLYPTAKRKFRSNFTGFNFRCGQREDIPQQFSNKARIWFEEWEKQFDQDRFTRKTDGALPAWAIDPIIAAKHIDILEERLRGALAMLRTE